MTRSKAQARAHKRIAPAFDPPIPLSPEVLAIWNQVVGSVAADHFVAGDLRMLAIYCPSRWQESG